MIREKIEFDPEAFRDTLNALASIAFYSRENINGLRKHPGEWILRCFRHKQTGCINYLRMCYGNLRLSLEYFGMGAVQSRVKELLGKVPHKAESVMGSVTFAEGKLSDAWSVLERLYNIKSSYRAWRVHMEADAIAECDVYTTANSLEEALAQSKGRHWGIVEGSVHNVKRTEAKEEDEH